MDKKGPQKDAAKGEQVKTSVKVKKEEPPKEGEIGNGAAIAIRIAISVGIFVVVAIVMGMMSESQATEVKEAAIGIFAIGFLLLVGIPLVIEKWGKK